MTVLHTEYYLFVLSDREKGSQLAEPFNDRHCDFPKELTFEETAFQQYRKLDIYLAKKPRPSLNKNK